MSSCIILLPSDDSERWEHFMKVYEMLTTRILYVMCGLKGKSSKSLKDSLPSVREAVQLAQVPPMLL